MRIKSTIGNAWLLATIAMLFFLQSGQGQTPECSHDKSNFSLAHNGVVNKVDSIHRFGITRYTSLKEEYDSLMNSTNIDVNRLNGRIDSLQKQGVATDRLTANLDSLITLKDKSIAAMTSKVGALKSAVNKGINELDLPPDIREKAGKLTSMMNKLDITKPNVIQEYLNLSVPDLSSIESPNIPGIELGNPLKDITNLDIPSINIGEIGEQVIEYQNTIVDLPTDLDGAAKLAEEQAGRIGEITNVETELGKVSELTQTSEMLQDEDKLKQKLIQEAQKQATDHFAGKTEQLDKAMQSISKYKQKFPTVTSLNDIPKKVSNEMNGKPLMERIVPGIAFQLQKKDDDWLLDINPYVAYRLTKRFSTGAGWNQRIVYNTDKNSWSPDNARIYGPRVFSEYKLGKGFAPRLELEVMNTFVPPYIKSIPVDPGTREWVWGAFVGMKKDYTLYKKIKGTASIMLRLFDPHRKSPYADVVNARFGFELPMKKKVGR